MNPPNRRLALITPTHLVVYEGRQPLATFAIDPGQPPTHTEIEAARTADHRHWLNFDESPPEPEQA